MSTRVDSGSHTGSRDGRYVPAYGPVDAVLGYALFYVVVDRATPTVVDVFRDVLPGLSPSLVRLGLAALLWFVLAATALEQGRRQLAALGVVDGDAGDRLSASGSRAVPSEPRALAYLVLLVVGALVATWTFDRAIETVVSLIPAVAALDVGAFLTGEVLVLVAFVVAFEAATWALDRLLVGGFRALLAE
ncbi:MAG: hypothetical protein V5A85_15615 [Haloarculaceae archaeon]